MISCSRPPHATRIAIVGTRHWSPEPLFYSDFCSLVLPYLLPHDTIISGASPGGGVDILARMMASDLGFELVEDRILDSEVRSMGFGSAAMTRNSRIVDDSEWMVALPCKHSRGTYDSIRKMRRKLGVGVEPLVVVVDCRRGS